jgi:hypothetical protein
MINLRPWRGVGRAAVLSPPAAPGWPACSVAPWTGAAPVMRPLLRRNPGRDGGGRRLARVSGRARRGRAGSRRLPAVVPARARGPGELCGLARGAASAVERATRERREPACPLAGTTAGSAAGPHLGHRPSHPPGPLTAGTASSGFLPSNGRGTGDCARSGRY